MNNPSTCPHFPACSGCSLTDIYHPPIWQDAKEFFEKYHVTAKLITEGFLKTRYKAKLAVRKGPTIGLFKKNTHEVLPIPHCLVHHPSINDAISFIKEEMIAQNIVPFDETHFSGVLRYIQLLVQKETQKIQLTLVATQDIQHFCKSLTKKNLWHSIWQNIHFDATNRVLGDHFELIYGEPFLWQNLNGHEIPFHPGAFSQSHLPLFEKMIQKIASYINPEDRVLELYAGVGAIGVNLQCKHVTLIENNPYAELSYNQMKKPHITYKCMDAKDADFSGYDVIIVDPPRKGMDIEMLPKLKTSKLIYVSCGFDSFKRDCEILFSLGWKLVDATGYLLFAGTNHVEIVALLKTA